MKRKLQGSECFPVADAGNVSTSRPKRRSSKLHKERFETINEFVDEILGELNRSEICLWVILWRDERNGSSKVSQSHIAKRANCSDRSIRSALHSLKEKGLVVVMNQGGLNRGPSKYKVTTQGKPTS